MKHTFYASSHSVKSFLPRTCTHLYFQEQGRSFAHTMNFLVVQQHHKNVQIRSHNLTFKQILSTVGVNVPLQNTEDPDITSLTNSSSRSTSDMPYPPTFEHLNMHLLPKNDRKKKLVSYKKYLMSQITSVITKRQTGIPKLIQICIFWFKEDVISL